MTGAAQDRIAFDVETSRILQILSSEIYDSPKAFLRENVQNAYDAVLMRCTEESLPLAECRIDVNLSGRTLIVRDDGIGMTEEVLRNNFWKAGSSGKKTALAQRSGVIGTFGIGAMANFGVCSRLHLLTRHSSSDVTLVSSAERENLRIGQACIDLSRSTEAHPVGTTLTAELDDGHRITPADIEQYLGPYVRFLQVPVFVNGNLISQTSFEKTLGGRADGFVSRARREVKKGEFSGFLETLLNSQGRVLVRLTGISLSGQPIAGELFLLQDGGHTQGYRNLFGLAPVPISGVYSLGGVVNLAILHPTAGREALSRESIQHVAALVAMIEDEVSHDIAPTEAADQNQGFQQYVVNSGLTALGHNVTVRVLPSGVDVALASLPTFEPSKGQLFYAGRDATVLQRFATEQNNLLHLSQSNPRRALQKRFLQTILKIAEAPETTIVDRVPATHLTIEEAMCLVRVRGVLRDDYLLPEVDLAFANISHGVAFHVEKGKQGVAISIARNMPAVALPIEAYRTAQDVFDGFVKDFVREHLYPHIREHVPSSTRQGRDALFKRLKENKELFRYEEDEFGEVETLLADYLSGKADLDHVLRASAGRASTQRQEVSREQVGTVEQEIPDIIGPNEPPVPQSEFDAAPPVLRTDIVTPMKVLTVGAAHAKLNGFQMFLALSDRAFRTEGEFFRQPHTTRLIWGAHRVIYIFTDATGGLSLYYDIELREPLAGEATGGAMFQTTTIVTKDRIYIPVPRPLENAFQIVEGAKEFYVRFDTIP